MNGQRPWWHEPAEDFTEAAAGPVPPRSGTGTGTGTGPRPGADQVGSAAEEAVKLLGALQEWGARSGLADSVRQVARQTADGLRAAAASAATAAAAAPAGRQSPGEPRAQPERPDRGDRPGLSTCDVCPVCQGLAFLRMASPEMADGLAESLAAFTAALRATLDTFGSGEGHVHPDIEHIRID